jgi:polysaccharide biosynthesis protein VpsJ
VIEGGLLTDQSMHTRTPGENSVFAMSSSTSTGTSQKKEKRYMPFLGRTPLLKRQVYESIGRLSRWLERNDYRGYDTFDGLSAPFLRPLTFERKFLRQVLLQGVRRFILNTRPLLGIKKSRSTKGMGFLARGFLRLYQATGDEVWREKAEFALQWLIENQSRGYSGACWGNHFDYQSRGFYLPKGVPTIVWTSLIGHAFLDGYECLKRDQYLEIAASACEHIVRDIAAYHHDDGICISYVPGLDSQVHNANTLAASLLARTCSYFPNDAYSEMAQKAFQYTAQHQRPDGSWYYAECPNSHWVDNFHTGYVLDCFKYYLECTADEHFNNTMNLGYAYWKKTFFLPDGTPRYYHHKTLPIDIQCCSQAIDTFVLFSDWDDQALPLAIKVAQWTIEQMQDRTGYFYYRRYSRWLVNKTPTLHWGQATMLCALSGLYNSLSSRSEQHRADTDRAPKPMNANQAGVL